MIVLDTGEQLDERERAILREHLAGDGMLIGETNAAVAALGV